MGALLILLALAVLGLAAAPFCHHACHLAGPYQ